MKKVLLLCLLFALDARASSDGHFKPLWSAAKKEFIKAGANAQDQVYVVFAVDQMEGVGSLIKNAAQAQRNLFSIWKDARGRLTTLYVEMDPSNSTVLSQRCDCCHFEILHNTPTVHCSDHCHKVGEEVLRTFERAKSAPNRKHETKFIQGKLNEISG
ncbi:MAG: hypothetical protein KGP28_12770 [Bdellovibrionales bacterium]|nr:hypothetical protein [Bdellovibrionales bacterium]